MSRVATLSLIYSSNLSQQKAEYDAYKNYVESNPIRTNYSGGPGRGPATTFSGAVTESGAGSISSTIHPPVAPAPTIVNNYYNGARQPVSTPQKHSVRMGGTSAPGLSELFGIDFDSGPLPFSGGLGGGPLYRNTNRGWTGGPQAASGFGWQSCWQAWASPAGNASGWPSGWQAWGSPAGNGGGIGLPPPPPPSAGASGPAPWNGPPQRVTIPPAAGGGGGGGWSNFFQSFTGASRGGLQSFLASEGFRGAARLFGTYSAVNSAFDFLDQNNQYRIDIGGATTTNEAIAAQQKYQDGNVAYRLPLIGGYFATAHESLYREKAGLASVQASTRIGDETFALRDQNRSLTTTLAAQAAAARGDYAGRLEALKLSNQNIVDCANTDTSTKITQIQGSIDALGGDKPGSEYALGRQGRDELRSMRRFDSFAPNTLSEEDADKIANLAAQRDTIRSNNQRFVSTQSLVNEAQKQSIEREELADAQGSHYRIRSLETQIGDAFKSSHMAMFAPYAERISRATPGSTEQARAQAEADAANNAEEGNVSLKTNYAEQDTRVQQYRDTASMLAAGHSNYAATLAGYRADLDQAQNDRNRVYEQYGLGQDPYSKRMIGQANNRLDSARDRIAAQRVGTVLDYSNAAIRTGFSATASLVQTATGGFGSVALAAQNAVTNENYRQANIGATPGQVLSNALAAQAERFGNRQAQADRGFGYDQGTRALQAQTVGNEYRANGEGLAGSVSEELASGQSQIRDANYSLRGDTKRRDERIAAIRSSTLSLIDSQITPAMKYGGRLEQVSAFVANGDRNNPEFQSFLDAQKLQRGAGAALDNEANSTRNIGQASVITAKDISAIANDLKTAIVNAIQLLQ